MARIGRSGVGNASSRNPARLQELRSTGLAIYKPADRDLRDEFMDFDRPIYTNPDADIICRNGKSYVESDAFRFWVGDNSKPTGLTRTLAVGSRAMSRTKKLPGHR